MNKMKHFYFLAIALAGIIMVSCNGDKPKEESAVSVFTTQAKRVGQFASTTFTGKTKPETDANLAFRVSGQIVRMLVKEGDYVRKGQVVAEMDSRDYEVQLAAAQAEYKQIKADAERVMALYAEGNTTASNYDKARYGLQQIEQKLANCRNQLSYTRLQSTMDGYVQELFHQSGETVSAGMPVLSVFNNSKVEVEINVSASDYANLGSFTGFTCSISAKGSNSYPLEVARVSREANSMQLYTVRLKFKNVADLKGITPGMTTMVYAEAGGNSADGAGGYVCVPTSAVVQTDEAPVHVFVYDTKSGTVRQRKVTVDGVTREGFMRIKSGLTGDETVVSAGANAIHDGQKVTVVDKPSPSNVGGLL